MAADSAHSGKNYLNEKSGLWSWLTTLDHKRISILYFIAVFSFFFLGGIFAMLMRLELFNPGPGIVGADRYNQFMTFHGTIMTFMVIIPGIPAFLGNFILPLHVGAKDVAFPRVNLMSWYCLVIGAAISFCSLIFGGTDTGWTFYTPYSISKSAAGTTLMVAGAFVMGFSSILTGLNFVATVHRLRCPGMTFFRMPLMVWALYSTAIIQIIATPVLGITLLLLVLERVLGVGFFDPKLGGDPVLFQHFFWFYSHPAVYIMIIPAMGIVSELITCFSRKQIFGYKAIAFSSLGIAAVSFFVWGHHMFVSGQSDWAGWLFSLITMLVGVPTAIKVFNWVATMYAGSIQFRAPLLFALGFIFLFTIGGVTGIFLSTIATDVHFHDTYFVVAHFHYVMVGGTLMAIMGGLYYWLPKMFGKMYNEFLAQITFVLIFMGFNITFFPQFVLGAMGMPRRYYNYLPEFTSLNQISSIGAFTIGLGFLLAFGVVIHAILKGEPAGDNPWGSKTLEWQTVSPPPHENFYETPVVTGGPYEYSSQSH